MALRIAFSGAHGVGKTTVAALVAEALAARGQRVSLITNIARDLAATGIGLDFRSSADEYCLYVREYVKRLVTADSECLLHDRTLIDSCAYMTINANATPAFMEMMEWLCRWYTEGIDYYFVIPIEFPLIDDGTERRGGDEYQREVDALIRTLLSRCEVEYQSLMGSPEERMNSVLRAIAF